MNNAALNHFSRNPVNLDISRSVFHRPKRRLTTLMTGRLVPCYISEVLPGDSVSMDVSSLIRMSTPVYPVMDNAFVDIHFYFVPHRLTWEHWKQFNGENTSTAWTPNVTYTIPQITHPISGGDGVTDSTQHGFACGTIGDYLGIPIKREFSVSALPFRAYCLIWNNFYRDQNTMSPCNVSLGDSTIGGNNVGIQKSSTYTRLTAYDAYVNNGTYVANAQKGGAPLPVCKFHDRFTSSLPQPQKGPSVLLPLGSLAPVVQSSSSAVVSPTIYKTADGLAANSGLMLGVGSNKTLESYSISTGIVSDQAPVGFRLAADLSNATAATVNELRNAFMVQRYYEKLARGGSRYFEMIKAFFNVTVPDATVQIPEFLGGRRFPINITQVAQTSATDQNVSPQGNVAAYSLTTDKGSLFTKSFTEHGYLIGVMCIRYEHSYSQGIPRHFSRRVFTDFYNPTFANAPEQPIYNKELYAQGNSADDEVFGYQEAWSEYRYSEGDDITGEFRPDYANSLDVWHYGDNYSSKPTLSAGWLMESAANVERTLAVQDQDQFIADLYFDSKWVRPMPVYSIPGLLDHH